MLNCIMCCITFLACFKVSLDLGAILFSLPKTSPSIAARAPIDLRPVIVLMISQFGRFKDQIKGIVRGFTPSLPDLIAGTIEKSSRFCLKPRFFPS